MRKVFGLFLPVAALILISAILLYRAEISQMKVVRETAETASVRVADIFIEGKLQDIRRDLLYLAGQYSLITDPRRKAQPG